jgi:hypothetical protein
MFRKAVVSLLLASVVTAGLPGIAAAEGTRTTYIVSWDDGTESSRWVDNNSDTAATTIKFVECWTTLGSVQDNFVDVMLQRDLSFWPDDEYSVVRYRLCFKPYPASSTGDWGRASNGTYYFSTPLIFSGRLDVGSSSRHGVRVSW